IELVRLGRVFLRARSIAGFAPRPRAKDPRERIEGRERDRVVEVGERGRASLPARLAPYDPRFGEVGVGRERRGRGGDRRFEAQALELSARDSEEALRL